jgi:hypothetical protein
MSDEACTYMVFCGPLYCARLAVSPPHQQWQASGMHDDDTLISARLSFVLCPETPKLFRGSRQYFVETSSYFHVMQPPHHPPPPPRVPPKLFPQHSAGREGKKEEGIESRDTGLCFPCVGFSSLLMLFLRRTSYVHATRYQILTNRNCVCLFIYLFIYLSIRFAPILPPSPVFSSFDQCTS